MNHFVQRVLLVTNSPCLKLPLAIADFIQASGYQLWAGVREGVDLCIRIADGVCCLFNCACCRRDCCLGAGLYEEGQPCSAHTWGELPRCVQTHHFPKCEPCRNPGQRSSQANADSSHAFLRNWTQAVPSAHRSIVFPKHAHPEDPQEREEVVKTEAPEAVGSFRFGPLVSTRIRIRTQVFCIWYWVLFNVPLSPSSPHLPSPPSSG